MRVAPIELSILCLKVGVLSQSSKQLLKILIIGLGLKTQLPHEIHVPDKLDRHILAQLVSVNLHLHLTDLLYLLFFVLGGQTLPW